MKSQTKRILNYLQHGNPVTPLCALNRFGCLRLSGRILELRRLGYPIQTQIVRRGNKRVAMYRIAKAA